MKLLLILFSIMATGCASQQTASRAEPDFRTPQQVRADRGYADNKSGGSSSITTVALPGGTYLVGRQGNTVTAIQISRTKR